MLNYSYHLLEKTWGYRFKICQSVSVTFLVSFTKSLTQRYCKLFDRKTLDFSIDKSVVVTCGLKSQSVVPRTSQGLNFKNMSSLNVTLTLFWSSLILEVRRAFFASKKYSCIHQIAQIYDQILKSLLSIQKNWN